MIRLPAAVARCPRASFQLLWILLVFLVYLEHLDGGGIAIAAAPDRLHVRIYPNASEEYTIWEWEWGFESEEDELSIIMRNNSNLFVLAECVDRFPTEWVFNGDLTDGDFNSRRSRSEYNEREYKGGEVFSAFLQLSYRPKLRSEEELICRSVSNHSENASQLVRLTLVKVSGSEFVKITKEVGHFDVTPPPSSSSPVGCSIELLVAQFAQYYYFHCNFTEPPSSADEEWLLEKLDFHSCETAAYCANTVRYSRTPHRCIRMVGDVNSEDNAAINWRGMREDEMRPGLVVCSREHMATLEIREQLAVEFFFGSPSDPFPVAGEEGDMQLPRPRRAIHFSQPNVSMSELIWMEPQISRTYYTEETVQIRCLVPLYGFARYPAVCFTFKPANGSNEETWCDRPLERVVLDDKYLNVHVEEARLYAAKFGPGLYRVECSAPVWNTTERAKSTLQIQVRDAVPLKFEESTLRVTFAEGATGAQLRCDAYGDPMPLPESVTWSWDAVRFPGQPQNGVVLDLPTIVATHHGSVINCTASNLLGHSVTKSFHMNVTQSMSPATVGAIAAALLCIGLLAGLGWMYFEYWKYRGILLPTKEDVREFWDGKLALTVPAALPVVNENRSYVTMEEAQDAEPLSIQSLPYNAEWEVPRHRIRIGKTVLGSGEFSIVYKGTVNGVDVGVKIEKGEHPGLEYFRAAMSELKILAHIGHHNNVVNLVAANASRIRKRKLYICVELCSGSLLAWLQTEARGNQAAQDEVEDKLLRWAVEIATGMEYIASKRIVHADLAARNVLLTLGADPVAKVGDFGLARLTDYIYTQEGVTPRPWAWMAIECFTDRCFSTKSDVWAYGVTLWEMWSLGMVPWSNMQCGNEFVRELATGTRLGQPTALGQENDQIYEIMTRCWARNPRNRPTFTELRELLFT